MRHECGLRKKLQDKESVNQPLTKFISFNDSLWNIYHVLAIGGFPGGSDGRASACNVGGLGLIPGSGRSSGEGNGNPLQYSCLENPMDTGAWRATTHSGAKSRI